MHKHNAETVPTYLGSTIPFMGLVHEDDRRKISEVELPSAEDGTSIHRVTRIAVKAAFNDRGVAVPVTLGNHYHNRPEQFTVIDGEADVITAPLVDPSFITRKTHVPGDRFTIDPGVIHAVQFTGQGVLQSTMEGTFNESGTAPHKLV